VTITLRTVEQLRQLLAVLDDAAAADTLEGVNLHFDRLTGCRASIDLRRRAELPGIDGAEWEEDTEPGIPSALRDEPSDGTPVEEVEDR